MPQPIHVPPTLLCIITRRVAPLPKDKCNHLLILVLPRFILALFKQFSSSFSLSLNLFSGILHLLPQHRTENHLYILDEGIVTIIIAVQPHLVKIGNTCQYTRIDPEINKR